ncbi:MAG: hypothetical protein ACK4YP_12680 [Myxococcota bacterium]
MSLLFALLVGCSNVSPPDWGGGGTRYALGEADDGADDTGGGGDTGDGGTGTSEDGPFLSTGSALYSEPNEADETFAEVGIAYEDDPDDVEGGRLFYEIWTDGSLASDGDLTLVDANVDPNSEALALDGAISFVAGPVNPSAANVITVYILDYTRNRSNEIDIEVLSE